MLISRVASLHSKVTNDTTHARAVWINPLDKRNKINVYVNFVEAKDHNGWHLQTVSTQKKYR